MRNQSILLLARFLKKPPKEVEDVWRDAKRYQRSNRPERGDYSEAYRFLAKSLNLPTSEPGLRGFRVVSIGPEWSEVEPLDKPALKIHVFTSLLFLL